MCLRIDKHFISQRDINVIKNDCFIEGAENKYGPTATLRAYGESSSALYIPFAYAKNRFKSSPNKDSSFDKSCYKFYVEKYPFRTDGGRDQKVVFNQAVQHLKTHKSVLLSLFCGFGKCLARDTLVVMYSGGIKPVQEIVVGDLLMGDDSTPRTVTSLARGREQMYRITEECGGEYIVNKSHILSLQRGGQAVDISVEKYIHMSTEEQSELYGYKNVINFDKRYTPINPYTFGYYLGECSPQSIINRLHTDADRIPDCYKFNTVETRTELLNGILDAIGVNKYTVYELKSKFAHDIIFIARSLGVVAYIKSDGTVIIKPGYRETQLYPITVTPLEPDDYYGFTIDGNNRFVLGNLSVTHNTYTGIRLAQSSGMKTAILAHRGILVDQWEESIHKFTNGVVQRVGTNGILDPNADFYIFNMAFVHKYWDREHKGWKAKKLGIYKNIGVLIVDEAHIACAAEMSRSMLYFNPRMLIALTATPVRKDGMDKALELYFGSYNNTRIVRIAQNPFIVYRLPTNIKPEFKTNSFGKKDWNSLITSLVNNEERNDIITGLVKKFSDYNILILTKRRDHCKILSNELTKLNITNTVMTGVTKKYDKTARVLLSTYSKLGVGFDDTRLNMLIVACSVTEVEQYAGRLRDGIGKKRVIIDLVDDDSNCQQHWLDRRKWYISRNGEIRHYKKCFKSPSPEPSPEIPKLTKRFAPRL